jgi:hypothetical protein
MRKLVIGEVPDQDNKQVARLTTEQDDIVGVIRAVWGG